MSIVEIVRRRMPFGFHKKVISRRSTQVNHVGVVAVVVVIVSSGS